MACLPVLLLRGSPTKRLVRRMRIFLSSPVNVFSIRSSSGRQLLFTGNGWRSEHQLVKGLSWAEVQTLSGVLAVTSSVPLPLGVTESQDRQWSPCAVPSPSAAHSCRGSVASRSECCPRTCAHLRFQLLAARCMLSESSFTKTNVSLFGMLFQ